MKKLKKLNLELLGKVLGKEQLKTITGGYGPGGGGGGGGGGCTGGSAGECCTCSTNNGPLWITNTTNCTCDAFCKQRGYTAGFTGCPAH